MAVKLIFLIYWFLFVRFNEITFFNSVTGLIGQLLEDIQGCQQELEDGAITGEPEKCFWSYLGTLNTVLKCVNPTPETLVTTIGSPILSESFEKITIVSRVILESKRHLDLVTLTEYLYVMVESLDKDESTCLTFCDLAKVQMELLPRSTMDEVLAFLALHLRMITVYKTMIPIGYISVILSPLSELMGCRFVGNIRVQRGLIKVYQEILNLRNFEVLQEVYKHVLEDLTEAMLAFEEAAQFRYSTAQAEIVINFYLAVLASLATTNSSIIAMWALQPTILTLLVTRLRPADFTFWSRYPGTHYAILRLMVAHCRRNNNFTTSSSLLKGVVQQMTDLSVSPTIGHFEEILKFLAAITPARLCDERGDLILELLVDVIKQGAKFDEILRKNGDFRSIVIALGRWAVETRRFDMAIADAYDNLSRYKSLDDVVYTTIAEVCCVQMCSTDVAVRRRFSHIFARLPLEYALAQVDTGTGVNQERTGQVVSLNQWMVAARSHSDLRPHHFKRLMEMMSLGGGGDVLESFLIDALSNSWYLEQGKASDLQQLAQKDGRLLVAWSQWEAAQICVQAKLRTPLGKAQDTFLRIESIVKAYARILALKEKPTAKDLLLNQRRARIMLGFLEALEKVIYNAGAGTAFAMPAPGDKAVRQFFRINTGTCNEWFNRIRPAVNLVAIHSMEPEMVIRCSESVLRTIVKAGKFEEPQFEETLTVMAWAYVRTGETNSLHGLHTWTKQVCGGSAKRFRWLKAAADQAAGKREAAVEGYLSMVRGDDCPKNAIVREFIVDQVVFCLVFVGQYQKLYEFLMVEEERGSPRVTASVIPLTAAQVAEMMRFEVRKYF